MLKFTIRILFVFLFLFLFLEFNSYATHLRVGVWNNPPLSVIENGKISGFAPELFSHVAGQGDIDFEFITGTWEELYKKIQNLDIDVLLPIGYSRNRLPLMDFSNEPIFSNWGLVIANKNSEIKGLLDLNNKKIAVKKGDIFLVDTGGLIDILSRFNINYTHTYGKDYPEIARMVSDGTADAGLISRVYSPNIKYDSVISTDIVLKPINVHFAYAKNVDAEIKGKIDKILKNEKSDQNSHYFKLLNSLFQKSQGIYKTIYVLFGLVTVLVLAVLFLVNKIRSKINELKTARDKAVESEDRIKAFVSAMPELSFIFDKDGICHEIYTNDENQLYTTRESVIGRAVHEVIPGELGLKFFEYIKKAITENKKESITYELDVIGGKKVFQGRVSPILVEGTPKYALFMAVDITELKDLQNQISAEKDKLNTILKSIADAVVVVDKELKITYCNQTCANILKKDEKDIINKNFTEVFDIMELDGKSYNIPFDDIFYRGLRGRIVTNCKILVENKEVLIEDSVAPIYDKSSQINGAVFVFSDVTLRKKMEHEIQKSQYLESIGRVAGGIAHDFNNYLAGISTYLSVFNISEQKADREEIIDNIQKIITKARSLTHQLLTFSKGGSPITKPENIKSLIDESLKLLLAGTSIEVNKHFSEDVGNILIDYDQFFQVIANIIINAKDAMGEKGKIDISAQNIHLHKINEYELEEGGYVEISIRDYGPGIEPEVINKIFEPFFTTKSYGNGLGLSVCYSIIKKHGGKIVVYSEKGEGTVFKILVRSTSEPVEEISEIEYSKSRLNDLKILYMDDEDILRDSLSMLFRELGVTVDTAENSNETLDKITQNKYDMVILDLTIKGGEGGVETAKKILQNDSSAYLVVTSGYSSSDAMSEYQKYGFKDFIEKPFNLSDITRVLSNYSKKNQ